MATAGNATDVVHMTRALELAARGLYSTPPNPSVGCVLLDASGSMAGEGWHRRTGEAHAEVLALRAAGDRARGATAYVTLEPCSHQGRTPPCAESLIAAGVRRVFVAMQDPNPRVAGAGLARLREAGVAVEVGLLERESAELNRGFVSRMARGRPWVTVKLGASIDGRTALADGTSQWITSPEARLDVQRLRARAAAILTGAGTVLADDPLLTVRDPELDLHGRAVLRVVADPTGRTPARARIVTDGRATILLTTARGAAELAESGVTARDALEIETLEPGDGRRLDPTAMLSRLTVRECNEVLVEAGPHLAGSFVSAGLADELVLYFAPAVLGETARPLLVLPQALASLQQARRFEFHDVRRVGPDLRVSLRPREARR